MGRKEKQSASSDEASKDSHRDDKEEEIDSKTAHEKGGLEGDLSGGKGSDSRTQHGKESKGEKQDMKGDQEKQHAEETGKEPSEETNNNAMAEGNKGEGKRADPQHDEENSASKNKRKRIEERKIQRRTLSLERKARICAQGTCTHSAETVDSSTLGLCNLQDDHYAGDQEKGAVTSTKLSIVSLLPIHAASSRHTSSGHCLQTMWPYHI